MSRAVAVAAVILAGGAMAACGGEARLDLETVRGLVDESIEQRRTDPKQCASVDVQAADLGGTAFNCVDDRDIPSADVLAVYWEFADAAAASEFIDSGGTSADYYLVDGNVVVDGPNATKDGLPDTRQFLVTLSQRCDCGRLEKKES